MNKYHRRRRRRRYHQRSRHHIIIIIIIIILIIEIPINTIITSYYHPQQYHLYYRPQHPYSHCFHLL